MSDSDNESCSDAESEEQAGALNRARSRRKHARKSAAIKRVKGKRRR